MNKGGDLVNGTTKPALDSVKSFAEYAGIGMFLAYQYTRAEGFPAFQPKKNGRILIDREAALEWMRTQTAAHKS